MRNPYRNFVMPGRGSAWAFLCASVVLAPLVCAVAEPLRTPSAWRTWREWDRIVPLLSNTILLAAIGLAIAIPLGTLLGVVLERISVPGRRFLRATLILALFVPLPVYAVAWQIVLGSWLPPLALDPGAIAWRPWNQGLLPAGWVHGMAAVPWVAAIVAASLRHADAVLEDEALMTGGSSAVVRNVLLPRVAIAVLASAGFVGVQTATEIAVTDAMMVRTFAEEVYAQFVGYPAGLAAAVAATLPVWIVASLAAVALARPLVKRFLPPESVATERRTYAANSAVVFLVWGLFLTIVALPFLALIWKAGSLSSGWSFANLGTQLKVTLVLSSGPLASGILTAGIAGMVTAALATWFCWRYRDRIGLVIALAVAIAFVPAPLAGLGLKEFIGLLLDVEEWVFRVLDRSPDFPPLRSALYDQPSPLPGIWACAIRFFPIAVAILLPALGAIPKELHEVAKLEGVPAWGRVGWPMLRNAVGMSVAAVAALSLGEVGASKMVVPPHRTVYVLDLFNQMHYGTEAGVAAMSLIQIAATAMVLLLCKWFAFDQSGRSH